MEISPSTTAQPENQQLNAISKADVFVERQVFSQFKTTSGQTLAQLSKRHNCLLIFRRFLRFGGCAFCNRRLYQIAKMYKSLLQLNIIPIVIHIESEEEVQEILAEHHNSNPILKEMIRLCDSNHTLAKHFNLIFEHPDVPTVLPRLEKMNKEEGFNQPLGLPLEKFEGDSFLIVPKMFLIRDSTVIQSFDHGLFGDAPDVISSMIFDFSEMLNEGQDDDSQSSLLEDLGQAGKRPQMCKLTKKKKKASFEMLSNEMYKRLESQNTKRARKQVEKMTKPKTTLTFVCFIQKSTNTQDDSSSGKVNFAHSVHDVLQDDKKRRYFKVYAFRELNAENITFYETVYHFKHSNEPLDRKIQIAKKIFQDYLARMDSPNYINTSDGKREEVRKMLESTPNTENVAAVFDDVLNEVMSTVIPDIYMRFKVSKEFEQMCK